MTEEIGYEVPGTIVARKMCGIHPFEVTARPGEPVTVAVDGIVLDTYTPSGRMPSVAQVTALLERITGPVQQALLLAHVAEDAMWDEMTGID